VKEHIDDTKKNGKIKYEKIFEEGEKGFESEFLRRLETIKQIEKEYWNLFSKTENESLKGKLLRSIQDLQDTSKNYFLDIRRRGRMIKEDMEKEEKEQQREENLRRSEEECKRISQLKVKKLIVDTVAN